MTAIGDPERLRNYPLFKELTSEQLIAVSQILRQRRVAAGDTLIAADEPGEIAYILCSGTVKIHYEDELGREVVLAILGTGELVGEMSLVDSLEHSAAVVALEDCVVLWINRAAFWECLRTMTGMTFALVRIFSRRMRVADAQIRSLATLDVRGRIARQLLTFAREYGQPAPPNGICIPFHLTQGDLGGLVGATRVRVNQIMSEWKRAGYLDSDEQQRITIYNKEKLARWDS